MTTPFDGGIYGPDNRIIAAQFGATFIPRDHHVTSYDVGGILSFDNRMPIRLRMNEPYFLYPPSPRATKFWYGATPLSTQEGVITATYDNFAYKTEFDEEGVEEATAFLKRQGRIDEVRRSGANPYVLVNDELLRQWSLATGGDSRVTAAARTTFYSMYRNHKVYAYTEKVFKESVKYAIELLDYSTERGRLPRLEAFVYRSVRSMFSGAANTILPYYSTGQVIYINQHRPEAWSAFSDYYVEDVDSSTAGKSMVVSTTGNITWEDAPQLISNYYYSVYAFPLTQDPHGLFNPVALPNARLIAISPVVENGKYRWYVLAGATVADGLCRTPARKYVSGLGLSGVSYESGWWYNALDVQWNGIRRVWVGWENEYMYYAEDPDLMKAGRNFEEFYVDSVHNIVYDAGTDTEFQFWSFPLDELQFAAPSYVNFFLFSAHNTDWPKKFTIGDGGLFGDIEVSSESPGAHWVKGGAYVSTFQETRGNSRLDATFSYAITNVYEAVENNVTVKKYVGLVAFSYLYSYVSGAIAPFQYQSATTVKTVLERPVKLAYRYYKANARHIDALSLMSTEQAAAIRVARSPTVSTTITPDNSTGIVYSHYVNPNVDPHSRWTNIRRFESLTGPVYLGTTVLVAPPTNLDEYYYDPLAVSTILLNSEVVTPSQWHAIRFSLSVAGELVISDPVVPEPAATVIFGIAGLSPDITEPSSLVVTGSPLVIVLGTDGGYSAYQPVSPHCQIDPPASTNTLTYDMRRLAQSGSWAVELDYPHFSFRRRFGEQLLVPIGNSFTLRRIYSPMIEIKYGDEQITVNASVLLTSDGQTAPNPNLVYYGSLCLAAVAEDRPTIYPSYIVGYLAGVPRDVHLNIEYEANHVEEVFYSEYNTGDVNTEWYWNAPTGTEDRIRQATAPLGAYPKTWTYILTIDGYQTVYPFSPIVRMEFRYQLRLFDALVNDPWPAGAPPYIRYHGLYLSLDYEQSGRHALVYWKPGAEIAWRICNPFLLDEGSSGPSLEEIEIAATKDVEAFDIFYFTYAPQDEGYAITEQQHAFDILNLASGTSEPQWSTRWVNSITQEGQAILAQRTSEWQNVRAEIVNVLSVWQSTKLASEYEEGAPAETAAERKEKIEQRRSAALRLWQAARVIRFNNFLQEDFFLQSPATGFSQYVVPKEILDRVRS